MNYSTKPYISVIIPCYNGEVSLKKNLHELTNYLEEKNFSSEVIIVDDGSFNSEEIKDIANEHGCKYLRNSHNSGKGFSVKKGILLSEGEIIAYTDADIPFEVDVFDLTIKHITEGADVVIGDRRLPESIYYSKLSSTRNLGSRIFSLVVNLLLKIGDTDTQCGIKIFRRNVAKEIFKQVTINGFSFDIEVLLIARLKKFKLKTVPVVLRSQDSKSVNPYIQSFRMSCDVLAIKMNEIRKKYS